MNEILRDRDAVSMRLVMTPDRMVIAEAMRTFTYLNLYGYLTDAVVVNRVFPAEVEAATSAPGARSSASSSSSSSRASPPCRCCAPRSSSARCSGPAMLDRLADAVFDGADAGGLLHDKLAQELTLDDEARQLRLEIPFAGRATSR